MSLRFLATFALLLFTSLSYSQSSNKVKKLSLNEGLSQSTVNDILHDSRGFLWVGTQDGLNQYNGYEFTIYRHSSKNKESISNNYINAIKEDNEGDIWIATSYGLNKWSYKTQKFEFFLPENTPELVGHNFKSIYYASDNKLWFVNDEAIGYYDIDKKKFTSFEHVTKGIDTLKYGVKLCESKTGKIWLASRVNGAAMFDGKEWHEFVTDSLNPNSLPGNSIWDIERGPDGDIWLATSFGLAVYNEKEKSFDRMNSKNSYLLPHDDLNDIAFDSKGNLWVVMHKEGLAKIDLGAKNVTHYTTYEGNSLTSNIIAKIAIDYSDNVWLRTYYDGVDMYNPKENRFRNFEHNSLDPNSLSANDVSVIVPSKTGEIWIGTSIAGLNMYNPKLDHFKHVTKNIAFKSTLTNASIRPMLVDSKKRLWVGTDEGLNLLLPGEENFVNFTPSTKKGALPDKGIISLYEDTKNRIWIGTGDGLALYNEDESFTTFHFESPYGSYMSTVYEDGGDLIAVYGTYLFSKYNENTKKFEVIHDYDFLSEKSFSCLKKLDNNLIFFGTTNGFYLYDKRTKENEYYTSIFNDSTSLSDHEVNDAVMMPDGSLYIATNNGLNLFDINTKKFKHFYIEDGLPNQMIYNLLKDDNDNIWMSTNLGLSVMNTEVHEFLNFNVHDGLQSNEFNAFAAHAGRDGNLYFGGVNGYNYFNPNTIINLKSKSPNLYLTELYVNGSKISIGDETGLLNNELNELKTLTLNHNQTTFEIKFVAIDYINPDKISYSYAINDPEQWINLNKQRNVSFNHLPSGDYTLYIKATSSDGASYKLKILPIIVTPPFYATTLFRVVLVILLLLLIFGVFMLRTRGIRKQKEALEKQVEERTKEVVSQRDIAIQQKEEIVTQKEIIEEKNREITDSIAYAKRIQNAILPSDKVVKEYLKESFIFYKPKDIVAGDFYWMENKNGKVLFAAADCTGHGVPGAMVSVVCNNALNRSVREYGLSDPGAILDKTREIVLEEFEKSKEDVKDGMDIALCALDGKTLKYAGAHNPLWIIRDGKILETKANKQPIGVFDNPLPYTTQSFELLKGDTIYIFTDGYVDQFGGEKGKKFKTNTFRELLLSIQDKSMAEQKQVIYDSFIKWKGDIEQVDDICIIGARV